MKFGAIIIGDEILNGRRQDRHMPRLIETLSGRGLALSWCLFIGDDEKTIVDALKRSLKTRDTVFCFGGIGATPDDLTRSCVAKAAGVSLERNPEAAGEIVARFGKEAFPHRIAMAELPRGSKIIPNPINRVPGFSLNRHYFLPGFPEMAWPMMQAVLEELGAKNECPDVALAIYIENASESRLMDIMNDSVARFPDVKLFSLPRISGSGPSVELGFRGRRDRVENAMKNLEKKIESLGFAFNRIE